MKTYIGDSVYAEFDEYGCIVLTTENGLPTDPSNRIVLEPGVFAELHIAIRKYNEQINRAKRSA